MAFCHGNGNPEFDGCCYVNGQVCPLRFKVVNGRILEGPDLIDRGTIQQFAATKGNKQAQNRVIDQLNGVTYACSAAINAILADPSLLNNNRAGFEVAWAARPEYQPIADAWEAIGKPRNWCPLYGPAEGACCYSEGEATNAAKRATLSTAAVTIRQGRSG